MGHKAFPLNRSPLPLVFLLPLFYACEGPDPKCSERTWYRGRGCREYGSGISETVVAAYKASTEAPICSFGTDMI
ncbi:uncharacterized protein EI90DRAFT_3039006 [Cantharellus anzutake]|uniref:uncharacterized protein n=1 Tax=Cantharellus anzutake TaxID=1750568 RepID=UPI001905718D|nr:uncharacterized protein EI90DRAFT_3039006 [Cantharellus anzutake]KAF8338763.1 hypothetical protein EI90DRAFT_3039006 [Cantharellus anzutake]